MPLLQVSVVKIVNRSSGAVSAGFVTYDGLICTCAHGVEIQRGARQPAARVEVYFNDAPDVPVEAVPDPDRVDFDRDVAFLRLGTHGRSLPEALPLAEFVRAPNGYGAGAYVMCGYPKSFEREGLTKDVIVADRVVERGIRHLSIGVTIPGFSGGPVWDTERECVIGVVVEGFQLGGGMAGGIAVCSGELRTVGRFATAFARNPHRFLEPFNATDEDAGLYFGRDREVGELRAALRTSKVVLVSGPSGAGKSSFVRAGLFKALDPSTSRPSLLSFTAGSDPLLALATSLTAQFPDMPGDGASATRALAETLYASPQDAAQLLLEKLGSDGVVSLDQYERVETECPEPSRRDALDALIRTSSANGLRWVVAVRSDFPAAAGRLRESVHPFELTLASMERSELREAIVCPAEVFHRGYEPHVVDLLLDAVVGEPAALPLLQFSLSKLWKVDTESGIVTDGMLRRLGFEEGRQGLRGILGTYADAVWKGLSPDQKVAAHNLLAKFAVAVRRTVPGGISISFTGRSVADSELDDVSASIAEKLAQSHLLVATTEHATTEPGSPHEMRTYSLAHEFLLTAWDELKETCRRSEPGISFYAGEFSQHLKLFQLRGEAGGVRLPGELLNKAEQLIAEQPPLAGLFEGDSRKLIVLSRKAVDEESRRHRNRRRSIAAAVATVVTGAIVGYLYFAHRTTLETEARVLESSGRLALADRNFAEAEIYFAQSLALADRAPVRDLLLQARSAGVSAGERSAAGPRAAQVASTSRDGGFVAEYDGDQTVTVHATGKPAGATSITVARGTDALWLFVSSRGDKYLAVSSGSPGGIFALQLFRIDASGIASKIEVARIGQAAPDGITWRRRVSQVAYDDTHGRFLVASEDASLTLLGLADGQARVVWQKPEAHSIAVHGVAFSADGRLAATAGADYAVRIWDVDHSERDALEVGSHQDSVFAVAFSHDGTRLASGGYDRAIRLWDIRAAVAHFLREQNAQAASGRAAEEPPVPKTVRIFQGHSGVILDLHFSADDTLLASASKDESARIWDVDRARQVLTLRPHNGRLRAVAFDAYGKDVVVAGERGWSSWHTGGRREARKLWTNGSPVTSLVFDRQSRFLAVGDADGAIVRWTVDPRGGAHLRLGTIDCRKEGDCGINGLAVSADGRWLAAGGQGLVANIWDVRADDWKKLGVALEHVGPIWGIAFARDGSLLATSTAASPQQNPAVALWNVADWTPSRRIVTDYSNYAVTQCGGAGRWIVGDASGRLHAYDDRLQPQAVISNVDHGETNVWGLSCWEAGGLVFSANSDGRVLAWDGASPTSAATTSTAEAAINPTVNTVAVDPGSGRVAASGDGDRVQVYGMPPAAAGRGGDARAASAVELRLEASFFGQEGTVWMVGYSPDGRYLAYGGLDGFVKLIDLAEVKILASTSGNDIVKDSERLTGLRVNDSDLVEPVASN